MPDGNYRKIIRAIDTKWSDGNTPFAIWELRDATQISTSTVTRVLATLVHIDLLKQAKKGYQGRHYRVTYKWTSYTDAVEAYEYAKVLKI